MRCLVQHFVDYIDMLPREYGGLREEDDQTSSDLKQDLEKLNVKRSNSTIVTLDIEDRSYVYVPFNQIHSRPKSSRILPSETHHRRTR
jgi:hypothetical protein